MRESQGYFSLVQYAEIPERAEYVNIGVVLFADVKPYVFAKFSQSARRAQRVFNVNLGSHFRNLQDSMNSRLHVEFGTGWTKQAIESFVTMRSGKMRLSPIRSVLTKDPEEVLEDLFQRLVGDDYRVKRGQRASSKIRDVFKLFGVDKLLMKPEPVYLSGGVKIDAPFAYQNGSFNLIEAMSLAGDPDAVLSRASPHMIEGELLYQQTALADRKRLIVVGDEADKLDRSFLEMMESQMERHKVRFYTIDAIAPLVQDIRENFTAHGLSY